MIVDSLSNAAAYAAASPGIGAALSYLAETDFSAIPDGVVPLPGGARAIVQSYEAKPLPEARLEAHRRFADIQSILSGSERIGYTPLPHAGSPTAPFDEGKDIVFLDGPFDSLLRLRPGDFALFLPQDAHAPGIRPGEAPESVRKVVVKIPVA